MRWTLNSTPLLSITNSNVAASDHPTATDTPAQETARHLSSQTLLSGPQIRLRCYADLTAEIASCRDRLRHDRIGRSVVALVWAGYRVWLSCWERKAYVRLVAP